MIKRYLEKIIILLLIALPLISLANHVVITNNATHITMNSATLNGTVTSNGGISSAKFRYATSLPIGGSFLGCISMPLAQGYVEVNATIGPVGYGGVRDLYANISSLQPGTTYYFCASATAHNAIQFGTIFSFTTLLTNPNSGGGAGNPGNPPSGINMIPATAVGEVNTINPASDVTDTEATFHGSVSGIEGGTAYGYFRYSSQKTPPIFCNEIFGSNMLSVPAGATGGNNSSGVVTNGSFNAKVTNLIPNTIYHYCAVVSNGAKSNTIIKYGEVKSLRTYPCQTCDQTKINTLPTVVINGTSANLHGEYGSTKALSTYFEYKSTEITGDWKKTPEENHVKNSYGRMTNLITGLRPSTHYVVRAVGRTTDPVETFYGQTSYFKTQTADGFGDGEGWIYDGPETTIVGNGGPLDPTQTCGQPSGPDAPLVNCDDNNNGCPTGTTGTPPNCVGNPPPLPCSEGWSGIPPNCVQNPTECPAGYTGVFPDCDIILVDICLYGGTYPNCNDTGNTCTFGGTYPNCNNPPGTCPFGGTYPNCNGGNGNGGNSGGGGNGGTDIDGDGINNNNDTDMDGDGNTNTNDNDTDGDGIGNGFDSDDDNDGIFDSSDQTPLGNGSNFNDLDGDGLSNSVDTDDDGDGIPDINDHTPFGTSFNLGDLDGDGINNDIDTDMDGDGIPDNSDTDDDNDGIPDTFDQSPRGRNPSNTGNSGNNNNGGVLGIGDETTPPQDAIVRYHEGVETVLIRQIMRNTTLAKKYGYRDGEDLEKFSWYLAHFLGKSYGYVAKNKKEVRVRYADVAAYELKEVGNTTTVYESYDNAGNGKFKITGVRKLNSLFKMIFKYEYYFLKRR